VSGAEQQDDKKWAYGVRVIPDILDRAKWRNTLTYRLHPRVTAGVEFNPLAKDVRPLVNLLIVPETARRPALIFGTSSDRIGTPEGQSFYLTASKNLKRETTLPIAPYVGVTYGTYDDRFRAIGGLNINFTERLSSLIIFDGVKVHPTLTYTIGARHVLSFLLAEGKKAGVSYSISF
jgi:hypothetical protein